MRRGGSQGIEGIVGDRGGEQVFSGTGGRQGKWKGELSATQETRRREDGGALVQGSLTIG